MIDEIIGRLARMPPRKGPEWGSGGVYGLRYHEGVLYYTLAFEAEARFYRAEGTTKYRFEKVGHAPVSGGDTYNAVDVVDDEIVFGGWVHAPAVFHGREGRGGRILFYNKYSHVHAYSVAEDEVRLLWKEGAGMRDKWVGEVTDLIYDPLGDRILVARGDGHLRLGVYSIPRRGGEAEELSGRRALKGALHYDHACFDYMDSLSGGVRGVQCLDLVEGGWRTVPISYSSHSVDGAAPTSSPLSGCAASLYGRYMHFIRGGLLAGNPVSDEPLWYYRLLDMGRSGYGPLRTTATPLGGGLLVAFNSYTHGLLYPTSREEEKLAAERNTIVAPSLLLYLTPPSLRVVAALGARITSIEAAGRWILLGTSTTANYGALDAAPLEAGWRDVVALPVSIITAPPPPVYIRLPGWMINDTRWGGIPLTGYKRPRLVVWAKKGCRLDVASYDISLPPEEAETDRVYVGAGRGVVELEGYGPIVSFSCSEGGMRGAAFFLE